ncbi:MAG: deoxyguanosinetriphosphate triphosphohydrolase [Deltaproteobacteria bacterium]|jgi:dGTPase|nr:deoxyguanosinetriphosphate triphosphohydrolase [Deltaproteobacteria bacterium]
MNIREKREKLELKTLHPRACKSVQTRGREVAEKPCPVRTVFQRDRDRIIHSKAFRRLGRKTQVFLNPDGDHYRTRLTHTLEVTQISRTIAGALGLNEVLAEAIALGHDLGHTPFGHSGESVLNSLRRERGGFHHSIQSRRVVEKVEKGGQGLNLTYEVKNGIEKHSKGRGPILSTSKEILPATLEGQVVRLSDIIAYVNHDLLDAVRAGLFCLEDVPGEILDILGKTHSERVGKLVLSVIESTDLEKDENLQIHPAMVAALSELREFLYENCYESPQLRREFEKAERLFADLWKFYHEHNHLIPHYKEDEDLIDNLTDFLAGMTDKYAIKIWKEISVPRSWFGSTLPVD